MAARESSRSAAVLCVVMMCTLILNGSFCLGDIQMTDRPYTLISKVQTECELEALRVGTALADHYNSYDEATEWDARIHEDFLTKNLGFAGWIQMGTWKSGGLTATKQVASKLHQNGGWAGSKNLSSSSYSGLNNQWLYIMGDSTTRQVWSSFVSPFQNNDFERNAKEWTRENCARQDPHRKHHAPGDYFPDEGWGGKCGNNELTCHLSGFGATGKVTFDWKHFTYEDYDDWLFGPTGMWPVTNTSLAAVNIKRRPDVLVIQLGLHTCIHAHDRGANETMIRNHIADLPKLMRHINEAVSRPSDKPKTMVIMMTAGRYGGPDIRIDKCSTRFNRNLARQAHIAGFTVLEREEIERRLMFKSEYQGENGEATHLYMKHNLHLQNPAPQIVGTSILTLISCLRKNETIEQAVMQDKLSVTLGR